MTLTAAAPGKAILVGEYAVLEGAPAVVAAVNRRVSVTVEPLEAPRLELNAPGVLEPPTPLVLANGQLAPRDAERPAEWAPVRAGLDWLLERWPRSEGARVTLDSRALYEGGVKLGLGSSAALGVALLGAFCEGGLGDPGVHEHAGFELARALHAAMQGPGGSGADVAASLSGGIIAFSNGGTSTPECEPALQGARLDPLDLPTDLHCGFVWTGISASTPEFLRALAAFKRRDGGGYARHMRRLGGVAEASRSVMESSAGAQACLERLDAYARALEALGEAAGLDIYGGAHAAMRAAVAPLGVVYKPCGAGGGDLGVAFADSSAALARVAAAAEAHHCQMLSLEVDDHGLRVDAGRVG